MNPRHLLSTLAIRMLALTNPALGSPATDDMVPRSVANPTLAWF